MKHRTAELEGALLDAAVHKALGDAAPQGWQPHRYSESWGIAGPIIEREQMAISWLASRGAWFAGQCKPPGHGVADGFGPTPLIAAMRAYVASKLGDEVELP